jgi:hypothetical protein
MTLLQLTLEVPDRLAREAQAAGLLSNRALTRLLREAVRREAGDRLLTGVERAARAGSRPLSMRALQREVDAVRAARPARSGKTAAH